MPQSVIYGFPIGPYRFKSLCCGIIFVSNASFAEIVDIVEIGRFDPIFPTNKLLEIVHSNISHYFQPPNYIRLGMLSASNYFESIIILNWSSEY